MGDVLGTEPEMSIADVVFISRSTVGWRSFLLAHWQKPATVGRATSQRQPSPLTLVLYCPQEASSRNLVTLRVDPNGFFLYWTGSNMVRAVLVLLAQASASTGDSCPAPLSWG